MNTVVWTVKVLPSSRPRVRRNWKNGSSYCTKQGLLANNQNNFSLTSPYEEQRRDANLLKVLIQTVKDEKLTVRRTT
jgi:hypothetical protein